METESSPARVLVVDDPTHFRSSIDGMLEKSEYATVLTSGVSQAIAHIEQDPPYDLVLSVLTMAGIQGKGLLTRMREVQPDTPLVLVTPSGGLGAAVAAVRARRLRLFVRAF